MFANHNMPMPKMNGQAMPRTPGGTPICGNPTLLRASSFSPTGSASAVTAAASEVENIGGDGGGKKKVVVHTDITSSVEDGNTAVGCEDRAGPTESMIALALRRKFANTRRSLLPDRRCMHVI